MLVLSRRLGERIMIGPNVAVTIVEIHGDRVRLGFEAPHFVAIHREEVCDRMQLERQERTAHQQLHESSYCPEFS